MSNSISNAIITNTALIESRLERASVLANAAHQAAKQGKQNLAVGTLVPLEQDLPDAEALLKTIFVLHRSRPDTAESTNGAEV